MSPAIARITTESVSGPRHTAILIAIDRLARWERCANLVPPYRWIPSDDSAQGDYQPNHHDRPTHRVT